MALIGVVSAGLYQSEHVRRGVHWLKFKGVRAVAPTLAGLLLDQLDMIAPRPWLISRAVLAPIPLHVRRQRQRGFNQAELIAKALGQQSGISYLDLLKRQRATWTQTKLDADRRKENLAGAFVRASDLPAKTKIVLLVDDVTTTGSTLNEAAKVIREDYPDVKAWGVTVARG